MGAERNKKSDEVCPEDLLDNPDPKKLNYWLLHFVAEVRRQDGQPYPPKTIHHNYISSVAENSY
jgi:uncharacterized NAD(P)/FAD-binding protein YdhS